MKKLFCALFALAFSGWVNAALVIPMTLTDDTHKSIGTVKAEDTRYGLLLTPRLLGLPPGTHGFHIHETPKCGDHGMAAGGHFDPARTMKHLGPYQEGHLGDLPVLIVNIDGTATLPILAPRLKLSDVKGHSLMIHEGGDNYSDKPEKLGGGGARIACGEIPYH